jgi:hypothetical protein
MLGVSAPIYSGYGFTKVGQRTGMTSGIVNRACYDIYYGIATAGGDPIFIRCVHEVVREAGYPTGAHISGIGDSGAPVFYTQSGFEKALAGILVAGAPDLPTAADPLQTWSKTFIFSPLEMISLDFQFYSYPQTHVWTVAP